MNLFICTETGIEAKFTEQIGQMAKSLDLYLGGTGLEPRPEHFLSPAR
jgi:hypothetical protein